MSKRLQIVEKHQKPNKNIKITVAITQIYIEGNSVTQFIHIEILATSIDKFKKHSTHLWPIERFKYQR